MKKEESVIYTIIGSTGNIGSELVRLLSDSGVALRAVLRNFNRAQKLPGVTWLQADINDESLLDATLAGTDRLFLLTGNKPGFGEVQIKVIHAAERLGIKHVVKLSALGASPRTKSPLAMEHWQVEKALEESSMTWTILRPHAFMQNWLGDIAKTICQENAIYSSIGDGRVPYIDARDIAAVAAEALQNPEKHAGERYVLTGGKAEGFQDLADTFTEVLGRKIEYRSLSMDEMHTRLQQQGESPTMVESYLALAAYQKAGGPTERVSESVGEILGRNPRSIRDFAVDYRSYFD